jgi:hypothetical protein
MREFVMVFVLLSAVATQAVNTTATLSDKSWTPSQQTLVGHAGLLNERTASVSEQALGGQDSSEGGLLPTLYVYPELSSLQFADPAATLASGGPDQSGEPAIRLIDSIGGTTNLAGEPHWSADPNENTDAGFVNAGRRENLPTFSEIDWAATVLPTAREISIMEVVVFPTLGALVVAFIVGMLIVRLRRRRPVNQAQQLLRV